MDIDVRASKKRFLAINRDRVRRIQSALRWRQRDFLELLPIFFHINHAMLPGYVSKETPSGIAQFVPTKKGLDAAKLITKSFTYKKRALKAYDIHAIFLMGSVGTIAHSEKSDFDIWLCYSPALESEQLAELRTKCVGIENWANDIGLEVHFFPMNADEFRKGEVHELSTESSGSTQHHLLLEEFYRTSVLVAGRYPIWWLVPPEEEKNYDQFSKMLTHKRFVAEKDVIDFGGLDQIPAEEYFGAALWQVYKGIDSPYKSVLKILLMETYADEYPGGELLCMQYKRMVYSGVVDLNGLDPYFMLLHRLENYLETVGEESRLELVRRCFYFKLNIPLSKLKSVKDDWRHELLWDLVNRWEWDENELELLDDRNNWKVQRVLTERKTLVDELTHSYLFLSNFAREQTGLSRISQKDLNILGRKLYAAFERKAGKVELINRGISSNIIEQRITLQQIVREGEDEIWNLSADQRNGNKVVQISLKKGRSVAEIIAWCHFNRIINPGSVISLDTKLGILNIKEVKSIIDALDHEFPKGTSFHPQLEDFAQSPTIAGGCLFANIGLDPLPGHTRRGTDIVSDRTDILNYSGFSFNLALSFDMIIITSWHEILTYRYAGVVGLMECLCQYLWWGKHRDPQKEIRLPVFSFSSTHSVAIAKRIEELFSHVASAFYHRGSLREIRYIVEVQNNFFVLSTDKDKFNYRRAEKFSNLTDVLSEPQQAYTPIISDRGALTKTVLPKVLSKNKQDKIQLFYEVQGNEVNIYVLDEQGSIFCQRLPFHDEHALLNQFMLFFDSVISRQGYLLEDTGSKSIDTKIDYCSVGKRSTGKIYFERKHLSHNKLRRSYFHVQVIGNVLNQKTVFTIYCNENEFSSYEYGASLFKEVAKHVLSCRVSGVKYPIYITDLDLAPGLLGDRPSSSVQIIEYLNYKKRIEEKLNSELANC